MQPDNRRGPRADRDGDGRGPGTEPRETAEAETTAAPGCFLLEVDGRQVGYFASRQAANRAAHRLMRILEISVPELESGS